MRGTHASTGDCGALEKRSVSLFVPKSSANCKGSLTGSQHKEVTKGSLSSSKLQAVIKDCVPGTTFSKNLTSSTGLFFYHQSRSNIHRHQLLKQ